MDQSLVSDDEIDEQRRQYELFCGDKPTIVNYDSIFVKAKKIAGVAHLW